MYGCVLLSAFVLFHPGLTTSYAQDEKTAAPQLDEKQILHHLNTVITWYRNTRSQIQPVGLPSDAIYQADANRIAIEVVNRAFQSAESAGPLLPQDTTASTSSSRQNLVKLLADTTLHNKQLQAQIEQLNAKISSSPKRQVAALTDQRDRLQGELDLGNAMVGSLMQLTTAENQKAQQQKNPKAQKDQKGQKDQSDANTFQASITQLKSSIPEIFDAKGQEAAVQAAQPVNNSSGLFNQLHRLYEQAMSRRQLNNLLLATNQLEDLVNKIRTPLRTQMKATLQQGRELSARADNPQPGQAPPTKQDFDALASSFDHIAAVEIPLSKEANALNEAEANLTEWRTSIERESSAVFWSVFIRVAIILGLLGLLFLVSDLWKRMSFKYVTDTRRRRQLLIVRRFVMGFLMGLVFIFGFVSEFSALATFAGFITAGLAVGLQTILLSVAAYFFLIGKYGLRTGDRITIAGVTGDVVEVGIVRFYLMELAGTGIDLQPTGRIVAFSNAVLFQATSPMFRQLPGTGYTWHEIAITLSPAADHKLVEQSMMQVIADVFEKYKSILERQQRSIEQRFEVAFSPLVPKTLLQLTDAGLEAVLRYPVSLRHNAEADDEVTRKLIELISTNEALKASVTGLPKIRAAIRG